MMNILLVTLQGSSVGETLLLEPGMGAAGCVIIDGVPTTLRVKAQIDRERESECAVSVCGP